MPWWGWALAVLAVPVFGYISLACLLPPSRPYSGPFIAPIYPPDRRPRRNRGWGCLMRLIHRASVFRLADTS